MRRADIARVSVVTDGADYDFTLPDQRRGVGVLWRSQSASIPGGETPPRPEGLSRYGVTDRKLYHYLVFASADFPRHYPSYGGV